MVYDFKKYNELNDELSKLQYKKDKTKSEEKRFIELSNEIRKFNENLTKEYPFLLPHNRWTDEMDSDYDYSYTEMDAFPLGWAIAFGNEMLQDIKSELEKFDYVFKYRVIQIKEKYGGLRWYDGGTPIGELSDVIETLYLDEYEFPNHNFDTDLWTYKGKDDSDKYIFEHRKILDRCLISDIIHKYENLSYKTCIKCGESARYSTKGWVSPYCDDCAHDVFNNIKRDPDDLFEDEFIEL